MAKSLVIVPFLLSVLSQRRGERSFMTLYRISSWAIKMLSNHMAIAQQKEFM